MAFPIRSVLTILLAVFFQQARCFGPQSDRIVDLPGAPRNVSFQQFSGYVTVNLTHGRELFYWFVESQASPSSDPLVLWLTGGPGCSSLSALLTENGPYLPDKNGDLLPNEYSWNKVANVVYLESPSGVGFSRSKTVGDYDTANDERSASDVVSFLAQFLQAYPQFRKNKFYVTGESYGGHYVPTTASAILDYNNRNPDSAINIQGIMVGNAWTLPSADNLGVVQTWLGYNLIEKELGSRIIEACNFSSLLPIGDTAADVHYDRTPASDCDSALSSAYDQVSGLDVYNIYEPLCLSQTFSRRAAFLSKLAQSVSLLSSHAQRILKESESANPCEPEYATSYLNRADVQRALHADATKWSECNLHINSFYSRKDFLSSMIPVHHRLLKSGLRVLIYSGDVDNAVPTHGTRIWIKQFVKDYAVHVDRTWSLWKDSAGQAAGHTSHYQSGQFILATVHGAGHMVPSSQPLRALDLFTAFLRDRV